MINALLLLLIPHAWESAFHAVNSIDYTETGANWEDVCATGKRQSPIDFDPDTRVEMDSISLDTSDLGVMHGHFDLADQKLQLNFTDGGKIETTRPGSPDLTTFTLQ